MNSMPYPHSSINPFLLVLTPAAALGAFVLSELSEEQVFWACAWSCVPETTE